MIADKPCQELLRAPRDAHLLEVGDEDHPHEKAFLIVPGEKLCLLGKPTEDSFPDLRLAPESVPLESAAQQLISLELKMMDIGAVFVIKNHHDRPLHYRALMKVSGSGPAPTSVCTVMANLSAVEHWPHPIELLAVGDFTLREAGSKIECR